MLPVRHLDRPGQTPGSMSSSRPHHPLADFRVWAIAGVPVGEIQGCAKDELGAYRPVLAGRLFP
jgi:hypothetical protein